MILRKLRFTTLTRRLLATSLAVGASLSLASAVPWAPKDKDAAAAGGVTVPWTQEDKNGTAGEGEFVPWGPKDKNRNGVNAREFREVPMEKHIDTLPASVELPAAPRPQSVPALMKDAASTVTPGDTSWTFVGPDPIPNGQTQGRIDPVSGRVTAIAIDPTDSNISYVGTAQGGLYRTLDGGATWVQMMDNATVPNANAGGSPLAIGALTIDPTDRTRLFVGTGEGNFCSDCYFGTGLYIITSANGGSPVVSGPFNAASGNDPVAPPVPAGSDIFIGRSINAIAVDSTNANNVFVATGAGLGGIRGVNNSVRARVGVYRSTNALSANPTWTRLQVTGVTAASTFVTSLVLEPGNPNNLVAAYFGGALPPADASGLYRTTDALAATPTWTRSLALPVQINAKLAIQKDANTGVVTVYSTADLLSTNPADTANGTLFKSVDGGANFTRLNGADGFAGGQGFFDLTVGVDPNNANNVSVGGQAASRIFRKSNDGGATFIIDDALGSTITKGLHADTHSIVYAATPADGSVIYHGNDGGIWRSSDAGNSWLSRNTANFSATQFMGIALHPIDGNFTLSGSQDNGTEQKRSDGSIIRVDFGDGGYSLIDQNATDTTNVVQYHTYFNQRNSFMGTGRVLNTPCAVEGEWSFHGGFAFAASTDYCDGSSDTQNGIAVTDNVKFYAPMTLGPGAPNTWYFGSDKLYRSADRADTATAVSAFLGDFVNDIAVSPQDDNVRIVGTDGGDGTGVGSVWATTTGTALVKIAGTNATNGPSSLVSVTPSNAPISRVAMDPNNKNVAYVAIGGYGTAASPRPHLFRVSNLDQLNTGGAVSFTPVANGLPDVPINSIAIDPQSGSSTRSSSDIYVGTDIGVYKSADAGASWSKYLNGFPRVAVFGLAIQSPNRVMRAATHGRGWYDAPVTASAAAAPTVSAVYSRKSHRARGTFDVNMPLNGGGVEPRRGGATNSDPGEFTIVVRFANTLAANQPGGVATYTPGNGKTGNVSFVSTSGNDLIVQLTNVADAQTGTLTVSGVTDSDGMSLAAPVNVPLGFNIGDINGDKTVNSGDVTLAKNNSGKLVTPATFRSDVNTDGTINSGDVTITKSKSGTIIP